MGHAYAVKMLGGIEKDWAALCKRRRVLNLISHVMQAAYSAVPSLC
jgi:hypothetical protein